MIATFVPNHVLELHEEAGMRNYSERFKNVGTIVVKVTHRCNLSCAYCYEHITGGNDMSIEVFRSLVDRVMASTQKPRVTFLLHGGEPTLMSNEWLREATLYAHAVAGLHEKRAVMAMQSNIIALDQTKLALLRKLNIQLSVSMDGPSSIADMMRGRTDRALKNYYKLIATGIKPGILMTINNSNVQHYASICEWLADEVQVKEFKANVVYSVGAGRELPDMQPEQIFEAQHAILEYMIRTKGEAVIEDNLSSELLRYFASESERHRMPQTLCHEQTCGAGKHVIGVTSDGNILPCGRFEWDDRTYYLGHVNDDCVSSSIASYNRAVHRFHELVPESWYDCNGCEARKICGFGCQAFIVRSKSRANVECMPTKMRFAYFEENRERLRAVVENIQKRRADSLRNQKLDLPVNYTDKTYFDTNYSDYRDTYHDSNRPQRTIVQFLEEDANYTDKTYFDTNYSDYRDTYHDANRPPRNVDQATEEEANYTDKTYFDTNYSDYRDTYQDANRPPRHT